MLEVYLKSDNNQSHFIIMTHLLINLLAATHEPGGSVAKLVLYEHAANKMAAAEPT